MSFSRASFTLIELLIVIAVIAVLATVVILVLNPAQLLAQSRDANRVSDMATINQALTLYSEDVGTGMGSSSVVYVSIPDPAATSSLGTNCSGIGLASSSLPAGWSYHCAASSTYRNVNGTGWIPVDFTKVSSGSPLGNLPVDPTNTTSTNLYYTYVVQGDPWELTANVESTKYRLGGSHDVVSKDGGQYPDLYEVGSNLSLDPVDYVPSLVGYWKLDEGSGTTAYDASGHGNDGQWSGTQAGTSGYYSAGHNQTWAGTFDGSTNYVDAVNKSTLTDPFSAGSITMSAWVDVSGSANGPVAMYGTTGGYYCVGGQLGIAGGSTTTVGFQQASAAKEAIISYPFSSGSWENIAWTFQNGGNLMLYLNGVEVSSSTPAASLDSPSQIYNVIIGANLGTSDSGSAICGGIADHLAGRIDDVRIYNRALSASEIQAIYNAEK